MDYQAFVNCKKSLIIAPAGYGKTYAIAECLKYTEGRQLVLTHTHAGIASLKSKFKNADIPSSHYGIETISGFLQRYVLALYTGGDLPPQDDKSFHAVVTEKALPIFQKTLTQAVLEASYSGIFIDEYQDCSIAQHKVLMEMARNIPCHVLGDPLQGIFDFDGEIVDFERDLDGFDLFPQLSTPHRWKSNGNNKHLGQLMVRIRKCLEAKISFSLKDDPDNGRHLIDTKGQDVTAPNSCFIKELQKIIQGKDSYGYFPSMLIVVPEYIGENGNKAGDINDRAKLLQKINFDGSITLIEATDGAAFYSSAKKLDELVNSIGRSRKPIKKVFSVLVLIFQKSSPQRTRNRGVNDWFSRRGSQDWTIKRKHGNYAEIASDLQSKIQGFIDAPSYTTLNAAIQFFDNTIKCQHQKRPELAKELIKCLEQAVLNGCTANEAMAARKNITRRMGKKIDGKCLGTTLLTKGLEFDTVVILDAHRFSCPKHFYVAVTRCCKQLVIFSDGKKFSPYGSP